MVIYAVIKRQPEFSSMNGYIDVLMSAHAHKLEAIQAAQNDMESEQMRVVEFVEKPELPLLKRKR